MIYHEWYLDGLKGNPVGFGNGPAAVILCPVRRFRLGLENPKGVIFCRVIEGETLFLAG